MDNVALNKRILQGRQDVAKLVAVAQRDCKFFNLVNCVTWMQTLARVSVQAAGAKRTLLPVVVQVCERSVRCLMDKPRECQTRHVSSILWACAKLAEHSDDCFGDQAASDRLLLQTVESASKRLRPEWFKDQEISIIIWALGKLGKRCQSTRSFVALLLQELERSRRQLGAQSLANTLYGLGCLSGEETLCANQDVVVMYLQERFAASLGDFKAQELSNAMNGFAKLKTRIENPSAFYESLGNYLLEFGSALSAQHIANICWSVAKLQERSGTPLPSDFESALFRVVVQHKSPLKAQEVSMCTWALANLLSESQSKNAALVEWLRERSCATMRHLGPQQSCTIVLALSKLDGDVEVEFIEQVAARAAEQSAQCNQQDLDNLLSAFARLGRPNAIVEGAVLARASELLHASGVAPVSTRNLTNLIWAFAKLKGAGSAFSSPRMNEFLASACSALDLDHCNPRDLSNLGWGLSTLEYFDDVLMRQIGDSAHRQLSCFNAQECSKLLYALNRAGIRDHALLHAATERREQVFDFSSHGFQVQLSHIIAGGRKLKKSRESTGTTGATGGALWQDADVLSRWLSQTLEHGMSGSLAQFFAQRRHTRCLSARRMRGKTVVELGAGLGLPSIVASCFGMNVIATDGDDQVLDLLKSNLAKNGHLKPEQGSLRPCKLGWGTPDPLLQLELEKKPALILASGVVYGKDPSVFLDLANTIKALCGSKTIVLIGHGNGAAPGVHQLEGPFYQAITKSFDVLQVPHVELGKEAQGCQIHVLLKKDKPAAKRAREIIAKQEAGHETKKARIRDDSKDESLNHFAKSSKPTQPGNVKKNDSNNNNKKKKKKEKKKMEKKKKKKKEI